MVKALRKDQGYLWVQEQNSIVGSHQKDEAKERLPLNMYLLSPRPGAAVCGLILKCTTGIVLQRMSSEVHSDSAVGLKSYSTKRNEIGGAGGFCRSRLYILEAEDNSLLLKARYLP